jgi:hypothetical protein
MLFDTRKEINALLNKRIRPTILANLIGCSRQHVYYMSTGQRDAGEAMQAQILKIKTLMRSKR